MPDCNRSPFADCSNATSGHIFVLLVNQYYLDQNPLPLGMGVGGVSALFTTQLFCLRVSRLDIWMDTYPLY